MVRSLLSVLMLAHVVFSLASCASPRRQTLAQLHDVEPDMTDVNVEGGLDRAMAAYQDYLAEAPRSQRTPEAMRRLADLKLEKEFGLLGGEPAIAAGTPSPPPVAPAPPASSSPSAKPWAAVVPVATETDRNFERRASAEVEIARPIASGEEPLPGDLAPEERGPREAIALYDEILTTYPDYEHNDRVLYQQARAYDELGLNDEAIEVIEKLVVRNPHSRFLDEVQFRRGEYFFTRRRYLEAEEAYLAVTALGPASQFYELALYKLGWAFYKQQMHEESLEQYVTLLDYKVSTGYDFDQANDEEAERRVSDAYRVISLSFSAIGGPEAIARYFEENGRRTYEDRIYSHLGEFYLEKLRYHDAASAYQKFVGLHPLDRSAPHFSMRVVEIYETGGFPKLVLEAKKQFAATYGLKAEYWTHFAVEDSPQVLAYLKANLGDLANHYHAEFQDPEQAKQREQNFAEASRWYRGYLASFPATPETPGIHHRLADLLLEHEDFGEAALAYERTAYDYPGYGRASDSGYAAIFAHREQQKSSEAPGPQLARRAAVESTLRFTDVFPDHEHAAVVLGAAVDDLYAMEEFDRAIEVGSRLTDAYPDADPGVRRGAFIVVGHASFDTQRYVEAEVAYSEVLAMEPAAESALAEPAVVENLAASIYKQGEQAAAAGEDRLAADHFLRIAESAPTSEIRPAAVYDAGAALVRLEDWPGAMVVFASFRESHPEHELNPEVTKQLAFLHRKEGSLGLAAQEYERVAVEASDPELGREALLLAGELHEEAGALDSALAVYARYVDAYPEPLEVAVETRFKIAGIYDTSSKPDLYREELARIIELDASSGASRTDRTRYLAARSALVLAEDRFRLFGAIELVQPFEQNLQRKKTTMDDALEAFSALVDYEVGEITAGATFYMAEIYLEFSASLLGSERPDGLSQSELDEYELVLEEEAFPFEERALEVHQENLELMRSGVHGSFIEKSLQKLAVLMPGRYAKFEASSGWIGSLERYTYRAPNLVASTANPVPAEPVDAPEVPEPPTGSLVEPPTELREDVVQLDGAVTG